MEAYYLLAAGVILLTWILIKIRQRHQNFQVFEHLGIPGPKPSFLWGNLPEINGRGFGICMVDWYNRYGEIYGIYIGARPFLCIADPELLKKFLVKDFFNFSNKDMFFEGFGMDDDRMTLTLEALKGEPWKNMRTKLSPTFTIAKVRQMAPFVSSSGKELLQRLEPSENRTVDLGKMTDAAVMEVSISAFTGVREPIQEHPDCSIAKGVEAALVLSFADLPILLSLSFPSLQRLIMSLIKLSVQLTRRENSVKFLLDAGDHVYRQRLQMKDVPYKDVLQLLIDQNKNSDGSTDMLTDDEIVANVFTFVFAGYDTSAVTLKFAIHMLACHQDVQNRLREEVREVQGDKEFFDPEDVGKLPYMEQVMSEVLRLFPSSPTGVQRIANKDYEVNGKKIPCSIPFIVPLDALHRSEKYWVNPDDFDPDRFSPEKKGEIPSLVYQPFGAGPRMCIGLRMANMLTKSLLALLLNKYRLLPSPETERKIQLRDTMFIIHPKHPVKIRLERIV